MATITHPPTLPKPPKRISRTINPCAPPKVQPQAPGSYDVFYGPFDSWLNVKNPPAALLAFMPAAVGDGIADDTSALQWALDFCGEPWELPPASDALGGADAYTDPGWRTHVAGQPKSSSSAGGWNGPETYVVYLPAGIYRITQTLQLFNRNGIRLIGEDPDNTIILYDGGDPLSWVFNCDGGLTYGAIRRLTFDANHQAGGVLNIAFSYAHGGAGAEYPELLDLRIQNAAGVGLWCGGTSYSNDADANVKRCRFINLGTGIYTLHQNALNWYCRDCLFQNITGTAMYDAYGTSFSYNGLFINCATVAERVQSWAGTFRGNVVVNTPDVGQITSVITQAGYPLPNSWVIQGNLIIGNMPSMPIAIGTAGPNVFVDNAFYDDNYLVSAAGTPVNLVVDYWRENLPDLVTGAAGTYIAKPHYFSGNTYNGSPLGAPAHGYYGSVRNWLTVDDQTSPAGYVPPNNLDITAAEIRLLLQATASSPILQTIIGRLPQAPPRTDPSDSEIKLTEINPASINDGITTAINTAVPGKVHLLHFPFGTYSVTTGFVVPGGAQFALIGDSNIGTVLGMYNTMPMLRFGSGASSVIKVRLEDLTVQDQLEVSVGSTSPEWMTNGVLDFRLADKGRCYIDFPLGQPGHDPVNGDITSGLLVSGFDSLEVRVDMSMLSRIEARGRGTIHTSDEKTAVRCYGGIAFPGAGVSPYYVSNGGSLHVYDMYSENQAHALDLAAGNGYLVVDHLTKYHLDDNLPANQLVGDLAQFTGHQMYFCPNQTSCRFDVDFPITGSSTTAWGTWGLYYNQGFANDAGIPNVGQMFAATGLPITWTLDAPQMDVSGLFGLTSTQGMTTPANLKIAGTIYSLNYQPPDTGQLAAGMNDTQNYLELMDITGFAGTALQQTPIWIRIDSEILQVLSVSGNIIYVTRGEWYTAAAPHTAGTSVGYYRGSFVNNAGLNFPTDQPSENFSMPTMAIDAWRYRPFRQPAAITASNTNDIVIHMVRPVSRRPYTITLRNS